MSNNRWRVIPANMIQFLGDSDGFVVGIRDKFGTEYMLPLLSPGVALPEEPANYALATAGTPGTTLTATGTGYASPCEFWGIEVSAYTGGPQTIVVRNGGAGGSIVATFTVSDLGFYSYSGDWATPGNGQNLSRAMPTDVHLTITGGTSRSVTPIISVV
jgi:hypothetical protein